MYIERLMLRFCLFMLAFGMGFPPAFANCLDDFVSDGGKRVEIVVTNNCAFDAEITVCGFIGETARRECESEFLRKGQAKYFTFEKRAGEYFDSNIHYVRR